MNMNICTYACTKIKIYNHYQLVEVKRTLGYIHQYILFVEDIQMRKMQMIMNQVFGYL